MNNQPNRHHVPVMLQEVISGLQVTPDKIFVDATLGAGGHTQGILAQGGRVIGLDQDEQALKLANSLIDSPLFSSLEGNFSQLQDLLQSIGVNQVDGILFDLGVSSMQLDVHERGFSFQTADPLDMRMSRSLAVTAADLVNALSKKELTKLFTMYAQESRASLIADHIIRARQVKPITRTDELAGLIVRAYGGRQSKLHPATKVFQALRMAVNDELGNLTLALPQAIALLKPLGRLVVLSFHEGEDRLVKQFFKQQAMLNQVRLITDKPLTPQSQEINLNPRARSAKLRVAEKK